jgi:Spy/CpxP family protein refolding chaperone
MKVQWTNVALGLGLIGATVGLAAWGHGPGGCHSGKFMQRMMDAHVEEALDDLKATPEQRQQVNQLKVGLMADFQAMHESRKTLMTSLAQQFTSDRLDAATLDSAADPLIKSHDKLRQDLRDAVVQIHDVLTPAQRQQVASKIQEHLAACSK